MNKDNVAEKGMSFEEFKKRLTDKDPMLKWVLKFVKEELLKKLPKECEFDCKEIINQVLKEE